MPNWTFVLADSAGGNRAELATATGRTLSFQRNSIPEAKLTISHEDPSAPELFAALANGIPHLKAYRDGVLRFNGYLAPFDEELEEDCKLNLTFRGPFGRLLGDGQYPGRFTGLSAAFGAVDAGQIAKTLIQATPSVGISTTGTIEPTKARDRDYSYANIGEAIVNLTRVRDGFDFEVAPIDSGSPIGQFNIYASQGADRTGTVLFQYGPETLANVRTVRRQTLPPRNVARILGANGLVGNARDEPSIDAYGEWWVQEQLTDISEQATLDDRAAAALRPTPVNVVSFSPDPALAPSPWDDYWLGDAVSFYGRRGAFEESVTMRVNKVVVVIDDEGNETFEIEDPSTEGETLRSSVEGE